MRLPVLIAVALLLGLVASELLYRSVAIRSLAGRLSGRGPVIRFTNGTAIYESDLGGEEELTAGDLVVAENLRGVAAKEAVDLAQVDREFALLEAQFGSAKAFQNALHNDQLSISSVRDKIANQLRGIAWLEKEVRKASPVSEQECRRFYGGHLDFFTLPVRYRASHVFLAAHAETPPDVVEEKEIGVAALATRLSQGESLSQLAGEASEDATSKPRGGDLGYFAERGTPPEFISEMKKLDAGEISKPFRSRLGFHIAQVTEIKEGRLLGFEEAQSEIALMFADERREDAIGRLVRNLGRSE
jgi:parvulin-like peptidyl-prolyl isomerase